MKTLIPLLLVVLLAAGCASNPSTRSGAHPTANTVQHDAAIAGAITGSSANLAGSKRNSIRPGQQLRAGDEVTTGLDTTIDLTLPSQTGVLRIMPGSRVRIERLDWSWNGQQPVVNFRFDVPEGRVVGRAIGFSADSVFEVKTPTGVTRIQP